MISYQSNAADFMHIEIGFSIDEFNFGELLLLWLQSKKIYGAMVFESWEHNYQLPKLYGTMRNSQYNDNVHYFRLSSSHIEKLLVV